jgi:hypothetical protein
MKKQKKFGRTLQLNKETISKLNQDKVRGGATTFCSLPCPCNQSGVSEITCNKTCWC